MADSIPVIALSPRDLEALRAVIGRTRNRSLVTDPGTLPHEEAFPNPEVHIVRVPDGGLPGRVSTTVSGTGSLDFDDDTVSHALCDVYRIEQLDGDGLTDPPTYTLLLVHNIKYEVFNFLPVDIETGTLCLAFRDKFGTWVIGNVLTGVSPPEPTPSGGGGDCSSCAWLADVPLTPSPPYPPCLLLKMRGGLGRCLCIEEVPTNNDVGIVLWYYGVTQEWIGVARMDADGNIVGGGQAMGDTCCGCGVIRFKITDPDASPPVATLQFTGVHVSCVGDTEPGTGSGSGSGVGSSSLFTLTLHQECCGVDPDTGRHYVSYFGKGPDPCNDAVAACDNTFHVRVECHVGCPSGACGCFGCGPETSPFAWIATVTGFDDAHWDGDWMWVASGDPNDPCTFTAVCAGHSSVLTFNPSLGVAGRWTLTHGGQTYSVDFTPGQCGGPVTLTTTAGAGHPTTITLTPLGGDDPDTVCCRGCDRAALIALGTLYVTFSAPGVCLDGQTVTVTWNPSTQRFESGDIRGGCSCDCLGVYFIDFMCTDDAFVFNGTTHCGPSITDVVLVGQPRCNPYLAQFTACISACVLPCVAGCAVVVSQDPP